VSPPRVVPALNEVEDGHTGLSLVPETGAIEQLAFKRAKKLSHIALSYASPTLPIDGRTPACLQRRPNAMDVYCDPWSLW
jgi:hypothetical protein